jgi:hypothetical protein
MDARLTPCRRCTVCDGYTHHWIKHCEETEDIPSFSHVCKHCDAVGLYCSVCQGNGCHVCANEGVEFVEMMPPCAWCDTRIPTPQAAVVCDKSYRDEPAALYCSAACHAREKCGHQPQEG